MSWHISASWANFVIFCPFRACRSASTPTPDSLAAMLRSSQTLFSPVRAGAALRNNGALSSSTMVGRTAALAAGRVVAGSQSCSSHTKASSRVPLLAFKPPATLPSTRFLVAYSTKSRPPVKYEIDREHEKKLGQELLEKRPGEVTEESSRRHLREPYENESAQGSEPPVLNSLKADAVSKSYKDAASPAL